jgi:dUTP pyrophosphatase
MTAVLSKSDIQRLMQHQPPLLEYCPDPEAQLQPNGIDITVRDIASLETPGRIGVSNQQRAVSTLVPVAFNRDGFVDLPPGPYLITHNEIVHLPTNVMALARPRSSLLRCGVTVETAVWDAGYSGRSQSLLVVQHAGGFRLQKDARVAQLVFFRLTGDTEGYRGVYQGENL